MLPNRALIAAVTQTRHHGQQLRPHNAFARRFSRPIAVLVLVIARRRALGQSDDVRLERMTLARYRTGLWRNADFRNLWGAATVSTFGTLITGTALPFTAILVLHASPADLSALRIAQLLPGFICGLIAGSSVDRLRRRPIMIATDLARAGLLLTIPAAALLGYLGLGQLLAITALVSVLSVFFDVAYQSYLPSIVARKELIEANSKLTAAGSVAEAAAFTSAGWLIRALDRATRDPRRRAHLCCLRRSGNWHWLSGEPSDRRRGKAGHAGVHRRRNR